MRAVLLFLAGALVGANVVYFMMARECRAPVSTATMQVAMPPHDASAARTPTLESAARSSIVSAPVATAATPSPAAGADAGVQMPTTTGDNLLLPVAGIHASQLTDTFNQARGSERKHEALDIMAARGTPVLAAVDGKVAKLFTSKQGGLTIYQFNPAATYAYYYAHLDRYAPGLVEGMQLRRGDLVGYVGSTGNANPDAPHLHFAIFQLGPEKRWWQGTPINPYPLLTAAQPQQ